MLYIVLFDHYNNILTCNKRQSLKQFYLIWNLRRSNLNSLVLCIYECQLQHIPTLSHT